MEKINLSGKEYPIRFDFRALKEYKAITKNDILISFDQNTDNVVTLTYVALKSGFMEENPNATNFNLDEEGVSKIVALGDMMKVVNAFLKEIGKVKGDVTGEASQPGEILGTT